MTGRYVSWTMGAAVLAASVFGASCSRKSETSGEGAARISAINLAYSDTTKVTVTIESDTSGAQPAAIARPIVVPLGKKVTGDSWSTTAQGIPAGNVKYTGNAYDASNTVIFTGSILGVITAGNTASVMLNLFQATPNTFANNIPTISALQVGTTAATPGQLVAVSVVAHDPDAGDTLTYAWTATCGVFAAVDATATTWTAPASSSAPCVITVTVTDNHGAANTAISSISVSASNKGGAAMTVAPDLAPIIAGININVTDSASPPVAAAFIPGNVAHLSVVATDDGSIASYAWTVNSQCLGNFSNAAIANPTFTVSGTPGVPCRFTVAVTDDKGQSTSGKLAILVASPAGAAVAAPVIESFSNSSDSVDPGQVIFFSVVASQVNHDALTFTWSSNPGSAAPLNQIDSVDPTTATPSSQITYTAPANLGSTSNPTVTVTVLDRTNGLVAMYVWNLTKTGAPSLVCMEPTLAKDWAVMTVYLASGGGASPSAYSAGTLYAPFDFGAGTQPQGGSDDVYVNAMDPATGLATWSKDFGDSSDQTGFGVVVSSATVGVIGNYLGTMPGTTLPGNANAIPVDFVLGLNPANGAPVWSKKVDLAGGDFANISGNPGLGSFFVCGTFGTAGAVAGMAGPEDLIPGSTGLGQKDIVVAEIDATSGAVLWAKLFGSSGNDVCTAVTSSDDGASVYITGTYSNDALNLGTGALPAAASNQTRIFMAKMAGVDGTVSTASSFGTTGRHLPTSLVADASGNVILGGAFLTSITFGSSTITSEGNTDAFVAKFDANLTPLWAKNYGGSNLPQKIQSVATDSAGQVFAVGLFSGSINIGAGGSPISLAGTSNAFTLKLDAQGNLVCGATYGGSDGQEADAITVARFATGSGQNTAMFGGTHYGVMTIGPSSISTGTLSVIHGYVASIHANSF